MKSNYKVLLRIQAKNSFYMLNFELGYAIPMHLWKSCFEIFISTEKPCGTK